MSESTWGALLGLVAAIGLLLVLSWIGAHRPSPLVERIGPFVGTVSGAAPPRRRSSPDTPWTTLLLLATSAAPGRGKSVDRPAIPRIGLLWGAIGAATGGLVGLLAARDGASLLGLLMLSVLGAAAGFLISDRQQVYRLRKRRSLIDQHLPVVAELLAFAVAAGESPLAALDRVGRTTTGPLTEEIRRAVAEVRTGQALEAALAELATRTGSASVRRFVDGLLIALERGTPIAEVLRAQAADCRADERRQLLELAGRKDVLMLVPVVFLVLPTVVLIALYPGIQSLRVLVA